MKHQYLFVCFLLGLLSKAQNKPLENKITGAVTHASGQNMPGKIEINGTYAGKNLFGKNPLRKNGKDLCISKIVVNGIGVTDKIDVAEFKLNLAVYNFKIGDKVKIEIFHSDECGWNDIRLDSGIKSAAVIASLEGMDSGTIYWTAKNEESKLTFAIEQYRWDKWVKVGEVDGAGTPGQNRYSFFLYPHSGKNKVRLLQINDFYMSDTVSFLSKTAPVKFKMDKTSKEIQFTAETMYEIWDSYGKLVKKGWGSKVSCANLPKDNYSLNYDNTKTEFRL